MAIFIVNMCVNKNVTKVSCLSSQQMCWFNLLILRPIIHFL